MRPAATAGRAAYSPDEPAPARFCRVDPPGAGWPPPRPLRPERLDASLDSLAGVGPTLKRRLAKLGLRRLGDLLDHRPRRYERPALKRISELFGEEEVLIEGEVLRASLRRGRGRLQILTARSPTAAARSRPRGSTSRGAEGQAAPGTRVPLRGQPNRYGFAVRSFDLDGGTATADFAPVYPASEEVSAAKLRELVTAALAHARDHPDALPAREVGTRPAAPRRRARGGAPAALARRGRGGRQRLAFDELLVLQLALARRAAEREHQVAVALPEPGELIDRYRAVLPFELTEHQEAAIAELDRDLARTTPMQRLLQGDVGSGKTVVALYTLLRAVEAGRQGR